RRDVPAAPGPGPARWRGSSPPPGGRRPRCRAGPPVAASRRLLSLWLFPWLPRLCSRMHGSADAQDLARPPGTVARAAVDAVLDLVAVADDVRAVPVRLPLWCFERRPIGDAGGIERHDVCGRSRAQDAASRDPVALGGGGRAHADRLGEPQPP